MQLTLESYLQSQFPTSNWVPVFRNDINAASSVFFIGYSLSDLDISRVVYDRSLAEKTFIIVHPSTTEMEYKRIGKFGQVIKMDVSQLGEFIDKTEYVDSYGQNRPLLSFKEAVFPDDAIPSTQDRYVDLITKGSFRYSAYAYQMNYPESSYATPRRALDAAIDAITNKILVHSNIGNGKTTFLDELSLLYLKNNFRVFQFIRRNDSYASEIDYILSKRQDRICFIFDGVFSSKDLIRYTASRLSPTDRMIISCRTITYEIEREEISSLIGNDFLEIDLNRLSKDEVAHLERTFYEYGIWGSDARLTAARRRELIENECAGEIRSVVLRSFS